MSRPFASNARAFTKTSNAVSVPRRAMRLASRSSRALVMTVKFKCQSGSDHYSAVAQLVFCNGSKLALIRRHMKTIRLSTSVIFLSLAFTSAALAKEKDEDAESDNDVTIEKVTLVRDAGDKFEPVKSFKPSDTFGALVKLSEAKTGTRVKGVWTAVDAGGLEDKQLFEKEVTLNSENL